MRPGGAFTLDLAPSITGFACGHLGDNRPFCGNIHLPKDGGQPARYNALATKLEELFLRYQPAHVIVEKALSVFAASTTQITMEQQYGLRGVALSEISRAGAAFHEVDVQTVRLEVLGSSWFRKGEAKAAVMRYCRERGWDAADHNAADAALIWQWFVGRMRGTPPVPGRLWAEVAH